MFGTPNQLERWLQRNKFRASRDKPFTSLHNVTIEVRAQPVEVPSANTARPFVRR